MLHFDTDDKSSCNDPHGLPKPNLTRIHGNTCSLPCPCMAFVLSLSSPLCSKAHFRGRLLLFSFPLPLFHVESVALLSPLSALPPSDVRNYRAVTK